MKERVTLRITLIGYTHLGFFFVIPKMVENKESPCQLLCIKKIGFLPQNGGKIKRVLCMGFFLKWCKIKEHPSMYRNLEFLS
jgi:hypothetical protein